MNVHVLTLKILLQHKGTGRYLTEAGAWVDREDDAKDFADSACATKFSKEHALKDVQITLRFETGLPDIALPVE